MGSRRWFITLVTLVFLAMAFPAIAEEEDYSKRLSDILDRYGRGIPGTSQELGDLASNNQVAAWMRKAAAGGDSNAQYLLAWAYQWGLGLEKDHSQAVKWYRTASEKGNPHAQVKLGWFYAVTGGTDRPVAQDLPESVKWFRKAAEQGQVWGQFFLGMAYTYGKGVPKDEKEGQKCFRKAAEKGLEDAKKRITGNNKP